jgi:hypothetical protein
LSVWSQNQEAPVLLGLLITAAYFAGERGAKLGWSNPCLELHVELGSNDVQIEVDLVHNINWPEHRRWRTKNAISKEGMSNDTRPFRRRFYEPS